MMNVKWRVNINSTNDKFSSASAAFELGREKLTQVSFILVIVDF